MNIGRIIAFTSVALAALASGGYFWQGNPRLGFYYLFAAAITLTVSW